MELAEIALLKAVFSEPERQKILEDLEDAIKRSEAAKAELAEQAEANRQVLDQAKAERQAAEEARQDLATREDKLHTDTDNLTGAIQSMNDEKAAWEAIRQKVEQEHKDRTAELDARQSELDDKTRDSLTLRQQLDAREDAVADLEKKHAVAADHARNFVAALA